MIFGKTILLTGGTGSFGQAFVREALKYDPKVIRVFSRGEYLQWEMQRKYRADNPKLRFFIGDVRDKDRLLRAMSEADIVVHAAALKHVPICEYNPRECILTNVMGALNVIEAAITCGVDKVISISSDKAVAPLNLYGSSKKVMEHLMVQANSYTAGRNPIFSVVRYGNVVGSRGSIIPLLREQTATGEVTLTDERMTRFWLTLEQGVNFVLSCLDWMAGGEIFIPKLPSMRVIDLIDVVAPGCQREVIGIRPGEKLHELLLTEDESRHCKEFEDRYVIAPEFPFWREETLIGGKPLPDGFRYSSETNPAQLTGEQLKEILKGIAS